MKRKTTILLGLLFFSVCLRLNAQVSNKLSLYIFLSPECPLSQNYTKTLNELNTQYRDKVVFTGIVPGKTYSSKEVKHFLGEYKVNFKVIRDKSKHLTEKLHGTVTPEVVLMDHNKTILYRGAIDDWAVSLGKKKISPTNPYLKNAIEQALNGERVIVQSTKPVGCLINDF